MRTFATVATILCLIAPACSDKDEGGSGKGGDTTTDDTGLELEGDDAGECSDAADNDLDSLYDCDDPDCVASPDCEDPDTGSDANLQPTQPRAAITPEDPTSDDDLVCEVVVESNDPEGATVSYSYTWAVDGVETGISTSTVLSRFTTGEEEWLCVVTPSDGEVTGPPGVARTTLARDNTPPTAPEISISPAEPRPDDDLECVIDVDSEDAEGDTVNYSFSWLVDGASAGITRNEVSGDVTSGGETWTCVVTPNDGFDDGDTAEASVELPTCSGAALEFNGVDDYIAADASSAFTWSTAFAAEAWVYWNGATATDDNIIVHHGDYPDYAFTVSVAGQTTSSHNLCSSVTAGQILFMAAGYAGSAKTCLKSSSVLSASTWYHVAVTYDAPDMYIFLDGVEDVYGRTGTSINDASDQVLYAGGTSAGGDSFYGVLDDIRVSNTARYTADFTVPVAFETDSDTVLLWKLDAGYGATAADESGNGHDGTIEGATWSAISSCDAVGAR